MAKFRINNDVATPQPHNMRHPPRPEVGTTLSGKPVKQGSPSLEVVFMILNYIKMQKLLSFYNPTNPTVTITYDDPATGTSVTKTAEMHEPVGGGRTTLYHNDVTVVFTRIR